MDRFFGGISMNKRIEWIDALRGFGILLVVIGHLKPAAPLERYIYSVHMFLFFSISGYLFHEEKDICHFVKKKCQRLLIPYSFWTLLASIQALLSGEGIKNAVKVFLMYGGTIGWNRPLWFLAVLFAAELVYGLLRRFCRFSNGICLLVCPWIWYMLEGEQLTMKLDIVPAAVFFLSFGNVWNRVLASALYKNYKKWICAALLPCCALVHIVCGVCWNRRIIFTYSRFGRYDLCLLAGMAGVLFYFVMFKLFRENRALTFLGKYSMLIMCSHYYLLHLLNRISVKLIGFDLLGTRGSIKAILIGSLIVAIISCSGLVLSKLCIKRPGIRTILKWIGV